MRPHPDPEHRELGDLRLDRDVFRTDDLRRGGSCSFDLSPGNGEREVGLSGRADVLDDHVDEHVGVGDSVEDQGRVAGPVGHVEEGDPRLGIVEFDARDDQVFHAAEGRAVGGRGGEGRRLAEGMGLRPFGERVERRILAGQVKLERLVDELERPRGDRAFDQDADLDLARRDHLDVDRLAGERVEHRRGDPRMRPHPEADDRDLGDLGIVRHSGRADGLRGLLGNFERLVKVVGRDGETDLGQAVGRDVLDDHVDDDLRPRDKAEHGPDDAGTVGDSGQRDPGLILGQGRAGDSRTEAAGIALGDDPRAGIGTARVADMDRHAVFLGELDRPRVHHPRAQAREFEHLIEADPVNFAGILHDTRIGRIDAIDIGINLASVGPEHGGEGDGGRVGTASAEGGDVVMFIHALEPGDDDDLALVERLDYPVGRDVADAGLGVKAIGDDADLSAREADRRDALGVDRHRHQRDADLFAGREQHVHLARRGALVDLLGKLDQFIGRVPARRDDHEHAIAGIASADRPASRRPNLDGIGHARPAEFLDHQAHRIIPSQATEPTPNVRDASRATTIPSRGAGRQAVFENPTRQRPRNDFMSRNPWSWNGPSAARAAGSS